MAIQILPDQEPNGVISGLSNGLQRLLHDKVKEVQRRQSAKGLEALGDLSGKSITPEQAYDLTQLDPRITRELVKGIANPKQPVGSQQLRDKVGSQFQNLEGIIAATDSALNKLESGKVSLGLLPTIGSNIAPGTLLSTETQDFLGDIANIVNLRTENLKGLMSKYRVGNIEKDKPSLNLGKEANIHRLNRIKKEAQHKLKQINSDYPDHEFESLLGGPGGSVPVPQSQLAMGSEIDDLPEPGSFEFEEIPEGGQLEGDGIIYTKRGDTWVKRKAKKV